MNTALITGVSRGIGKATAEKFLAEGWSVIGTSTTGKASIKNTKLKLYKLNLVEPKSIEQFAKRLKKEKLDVLVNNAGIFLESDKNEISVEGLRKTLEVNLIGLVDLTQKIFPQINDGGRIINISSALASLNDFGGHYAPAYQISKTALNMYTRTLASTTKKRNIIVASIDPGWVKTDMGGKGADREPSLPAKEIYDLATKKIDSGFFWHKGKQRSW